MILEGWAPHDLALHQRIVNGSVAGLSDDSVPWFLLFLMSLDLDTCKLQRHPLLIVFFLSDLIVLGICG